MTIPAPTLDTSIRFHAMDGIRASMMLLGIFFHAVWFFFPLWLGFPATDAASDWAPTYFFYWVHTFRMQAFFVIAGFFACLLIEKRGILRFSGNRALRVVIPFLIFTPLLYPLMQYQAARGGIESGRIQEGGSAWEVLKAEFANQNWLEVWPIHLWFLETLILLYVISLTLLLLFRYVVDRKQHVRQRLQLTFARAIGSPWGILWVTLPIAAILFWEESWYGLDTGPLKPKWLGVIGYWIYFAVGWCLFRQPQLLNHFNRRWGSKLVVGSVLALGLNYYCNSLLQEGRFSWFYPMINQTEVRDYAALRQQLLLVREQETPSVTGRVWENLGPNYQDFLLRQRDVTGDQLAGLVMKINLTSVTDPSLADPSYCGDLKLEPQWASILALPVEQRTPEQMLELNRKVLEAALAPVLLSKWPAPLLSRVVYFLLYSLASTLLIFGSIGLFQRLCSQPHPAFRYWSDSSYWLYLAHLPLQYEINIWLAPIEMNWLLKSSLYVLISFAILVPSYHYLVRSTWLGVLLNGRRYPFIPITELGHWWPLGKPLAEPVPAGAGHKICAGPHPCPEMIAAQGASIEADGEVAKEPS